MSHTLKVLLFISLMQTLREDSLNKTNNPLILLGQVSTETITFTMICALSNKQVMTSVNGGKMPKDTR